MKPHVLLRRLEGLEIGWQVKPHLLQRSSIDGRFSPGGKEGTKQRSCSVDPAGTADMIFLHQQKD